MMVVLLLYAYRVGIPSSRRIERACWEDAAFRVLTGNQQPDHSRISDFWVTSSPRIRRATSCAGAGLRRPRSSMSIRGW
jgi:transposase